LDFGNVLLLEFTNQSDYVTFIECHFPKVFQSRWYQTLCNVVRSKGFEYLIDCVLVANAVIIAIQSYPELSGADVAMNPHYNDG
jgi:two pore calcium channel protein